MHKVLTCQKTQEINVLDVVNSKQAQWNASHLFVSVENKNNIRD